MGEAITIGKVFADDFAGVKWVALAMAKESSRYHLNFVQSIGKHIVCTDGHRLHAYRMKDFVVPKGMYKLVATKQEVILIPAEADVTGPDVMQVFPWKEKTWRKAEIGRTVSYGYTNLVRIMEDTETVELKYYEDMVSGAEWGRFRYFGGGKPIWMKNGRRCGLVMPMRF